jgi:hypothetical protein
MLHTLTVLKTEDLGGGPLHQGKYGLSVNYQVCLELLSNETA